MGPAGPGMGVSAHCQRTDCRLDRPRAPRDSAPSRLPTWLPHAPDTLNCGAMGSSHGEHPDACGSPTGRGLPSGGGWGDKLLSQPHDAIAQHRPGLGAGGSPPCAFRPGQGVHWRVSGRDSRSGRPRQRTNLAWAVAGSGRALLGQPQAAQTAPQRELPRSRSGK